MEIIDSIRFFKITSTFEFIPFTQSRGMFEFHALSGKERIKFFVDDSTKPMIACMGHEKKMLGKKMLQVEGECCLNSAAFSPEKVGSFFKELTSLGYHMIEICSNTRYSFDYETGMRQAGYLRPVGQFSMPITKIIDLTNDITYGRNWKRKLKKVEGVELLLEGVEKPSLEDCSDFIRIYNEMLERKAMRSGFTVKQIFKLCSTSDFFLFFVKHKEKRVTAIIIHNNGIHAGLLYAATGKEALDLSASYFMYQSLFERLKKSGVKTFDMEKLVPSTEAVNNVFLFKNGITGEHVVLNGEFSWYKKKYYRPLMYYVKKHMMKKREL